MRISLAVRYASGALGAAAILAGCSSGGPQLSALGPTALNTGEPSTHLPVRLQDIQGLSVGRGEGAPVHPDHSRSWILPDARQARQFLFVSDAGNDDVYVFTMPNLSLKGTLTGFNLPQGECSDKNGDIWIMNTEAAQMLKYSRTGTLKETLTDTSGYPAGCAVNKSNGDLAVTNILNLKYGSGAVLIYRNASGKPKSYSGANLFLYLLDGYDPNGNLFIDGCTTAHSACFEGHSSFALAELPKGDRSLEAINISGGTIRVPGMVEWYSPGGYLAVGDQYCGSQTSCVDWVSISGSADTITGTTPLYNATGGPSCDVTGAVLTPGQRAIAGPDFELSASQGCGYAATSADRWSFPAGGTPINSSSTELVEPIGAAISSKKPATPSRGR